MLTLGTFGGYEFDPTLKFLYFNIVSWNLAQLDLIQGQIIISNIPNWQDFLFQNPQYVTRSIGGKVQSGSKPNEIGFNAEDFLIACDHID